MKITLHSFLVGALIGGVIINFAGWCIAFYMTDFWSATRLDFDERATLCYVFGYILDRLGEPTK